MTARRGLVLDVDRTTPPIVFHHGEGFRFEKPRGVELFIPTNQSNRSKTSTALFDTPSLIHWAIHLHSKRFLRLA